ncbi:hypothetical protein TRVL_09956 [Trypanosoma vivax]|nr:hypothetical protein TRVL_09956 [Trypanosoma vivax]
MCYELTRFVCSLSCDDLAHSIRLSRMVLHVDHLMACSRARDRVLALRGWDAMATEVVFELLLHEAAVKDGKGNRYGSALEYPEVGLGEGAKEQNETQLEGWLIGWDAFRRLKR